MEKKKKEEIPYFSLPRRDMSLVEDENMYENDIVFNVWWVSGSL